MDPSEQTRIGAATYFRMSLRSFGDFVGAFIPGVSSLTGFWGEWETNQKFADLEARINVLEIPPDSQEAPLIEEKNAEEHFKEASPTFYQATGRIVAWSESSLVLEVQDGDSIFQLHIKRNVDTRMLRSPKKGQVTGVSFSVDRDGQCHALAIGQHLSQIGLSQPTLDSIENITSSRTKLIEVSVFGITACSEEDVLSVVQLRPGCVVSRKELRDALQAISDLGLFTKVRFRLQEDAKGMRLHFLVLENPIIEEIKVEGCHLVSAPTIQENLGVQVGEVLNMSKLRSGLQQINELYGSKGLTNIGSHVSKVSIEKNVLFLHLVEEFKPEEVTFQGLLANIDEVLDEAFGDNWLYLGVRKFFGSPTAAFATMLGMTAGKPLTEDLLKRASETIRAVYKQLDLIAYDVQYRFSGQNQELTISVTEGYLNDVVFTKRPEFFRSLTEGWKSRRVGSLIRRSELKDFLAMVNARSYVVDLAVQWSETEGKPGHLNMEITPKLIDLYSECGNWLETLCRESPFFKKNSLSEIKILSLDHQPISNIADVAKFSGLENLDLEGTLVASIDCLKHLKELKTLILSHTSVECLAPLKFLKKLEHLRIDKTPVKRLPSGLSNQILTIAADGSSLSDISELKSLESLELLSLSETPVTDLGPLKGKRIKTLLFAALDKVVDFSVIGTVTGLVTLGLDRNDIKDFSFLENLSEMKNLYLGGYPHRNAPELPASGLVQLSFYNSRVSSLASLERLDTLEELYLQYSKVRDLSPLSNLSNLKYLDVRDTPIRREEAEILKLKIPEVTIFLSDPMDPQQSIKL